MGATVCWMSVMCQNCMRSEQLQSVASFCSMWVHIGDAVDSAGINQFCRAMMPCMCSYLNVNSCRCTHALQTIGCTAPYCRHNNTLQILCNQLIVTPTWQRCSLPKRCLSSELDKMC